MSGTVFFPLDHPVRIVLIDKATGDAAHTEDVTAEFLSATLLRLRITWNALGVIGGTRWRNPGTGDLYPAGLTVRVFTTHPETGDVVELDPIQFL